MESLREEVQSFILENQLEGKAVEAMWNVSPVIQKAVIGLGSLKGCKNRTAGCLGRIKTLQGKEGELHWMAQRKQEPDQRVLLEEVEQFLANNRIQERAAARLRDAGPMVQRQVMDLGPVKGRNIDAVLVSRINGVQSGKSFEAQPTGKWSSTPTVPAAQHLQNNQQSCPVVTNEEVQQFITDNNIEHGAANMLRSAGPLVQREVLDIGPLKGRNLSAICVARIRDAVQRLKETSASSASGSDEYDVPPEFTFNSGISARRKQLVEMGIFPVLPSPQPTGEKFPQPPGAEPPGEKRRRVSGWDARTPPPNYEQAFPPTSWV